MRPLLAGILGVVLAGLSFSGVVPSSSTVAGDEARTGGEAGDASRALTFGPRLPDAETLLRRFVPGTPPGNRRPNENDPVELQAIVDDLNSLGAELARRQHRIVTEIARERIDGGEVAATGTGEGGFDLPDGALGARIEYRDGDLYHAVVWPGDSPELDRVTAELARHHELSEQLIEFLVRNREGEGR